VDRRGRGGNGVVVVGAVVVVVVVSAVATAGAYARAAIMATATTPRVLNFIMWTLSKEQGNCKFEILKPCEVLVYSL